MAIELDKVSYKYNENTPLERRGINEITAKFIPAKINAIIGPSGSGKSTMVELMNGLLIPSSGVLNSFGIEIKKGKKIKDINELRRKVSLSFQNPEDQLFNRTVKEEILFGINQKKYTEEELDKKVSAALNMLGMKKDVLERNPLYMSKGEKRKVAIMASLIHNPDVLILDEPTVGLDGSSKKELFKILEHLKKEYGKTIIIVSNDIEFIYKISDYIYLLKGGSLVMNGTKEQVFQNLDILRNNGIIIPKILEFIDLARKKKGVNLDNYFDTHELMKAIYRNVE